MTAVKPKKSHPWGWSANMPAKKKTAKKAFSMASEKKSHGKKHERMEGKSFEKKERGMKGYPFGKEKY